MCIQSVTNAQSGGAKTTQGDPGAAKVSIARYERSQVGAAQGSAELSLGSAGIAEVLRQLVRAIEMLVHAMSGSAQNSTGRMDIAQQPSLTAGGSSTTQPVSGGGTSYTGGASTTFLQPGTLKVGVNWEGLDEISPTGKTPQMVRKFDSFDSTKVTAKEKELVAQGSILFKSLKPISRKSGQTHSWAEVASGNHDAFLKEYLLNLKKDGGKNVILAFNHEADGKQNKDKGTPEEFVAAWRHIHDLADELGVTRKAGGNVEFAWTMVGWGFNQDRVGPYYPGNDYVDYVGTDPYDNSKTGKDRGSFMNSVDDTLTWMDKNNIDKPVIVGETGTESGMTAGRTSTQAEWIQQMMNDWKSNPAMQRIVAINYWSNQVDKSGSTNFALESQAAQTLASYM